MARMAHLVIIKKKKRIFHSVDIVVLVDYVVKIKESQRNRQMFGSSKKAEKKKSGK